MIKRFRDSEYYQHVIRLRFSIKVVKDNFRGLLYTQRDFKKEFEGSFRRLFMLGPYKKLVDVIFHENNEEDLKRFLRMVIDSVNPNDFLEINLKGFNRFFSTQALMFSYEGEYIPEYEGIIQNMKSAFPWLFKRIGKPLNYWEYNELCRVIKDSYEFKDLAELFEFLSHFKELGE